MKKMLLVMVAALFIPQLAMCQALTNSEIRIKKVIAEKYLNTQIKHLLNRDVKMSKAIKKYNDQAKKTPALVREMENPRQWSIFGIPLVMEESYAWKEPVAANLNSYNFKDKYLKHYPFLEITKFTVEDEGASVQEAEEYLHKGETSWYHSNMGEVTTEHSINPTDYIRVIKFPMRENESGDEVAYIPEAIVVDRIFAGRGKGTFFRVKLEYFYATENPQLFKGFYKAIKEAPKDLFIRNFVMEECKFGRECYD